MHRSDGPESGRRESHVEQVLYQVVTVVYSSIERESRPAIASSPTNILLEPVIEPSHIHTGGKY